MSIASRRDFLKCLAFTAAASQMPFALRKAVAASNTEGVRWIFLGTKGGPSVTTGRSNPANVLLVDGVPYVVDCGYGVSRQLVEADVPLSTIHYLFVTHLHSDHALEFGNLVYNAWARGLKHRVDAFGPVGLKHLAKSFWESNEFDLGIRVEDEGKPDPRKLLHVAEISDSGSVMQNDAVTVAALKTPHPPIEENFAFKFETPRGTIVYACDTAYNPELADFARGADVLIHEALYVPGIDSLLQKIKNAESLKEHLLASHTTTEDVGRIAAAAGVKKLVLTHLVPGYADPPITDDMWLEGVRKHYDGPALVASDLMTLDL